MTSEDGHGHGDRERAGRRRSSRRSPTGRPGRRRWTSCSRRWPTIRTATSSRTSGSSATAARRSAPRPSTRYLTPGDYTATLTVTDTGGQHGHGDDRDHGRGPGRATRRRRSRRRRCRRPGTAPLDVQFSATGHRSRRRRADLPVGVRRRVGRRGGPPRAARVHAQRHVHRHGDRDRPGGEHRHRHGRDHGRQPGGQPGADGRRRRPIRPAGPRR